MISAFLPYSQGMDITPYLFPDATPEDQLRYLKQQYATAAKAQVIRNGDGREVERQSLSALSAEIQRLESIIVGRGGIVHTAHARS